MPVLHPKIGRSLHSTRKYWARLFFKKTSVLSIYRTIHSFWSPYIELVCGRSLWNGNRLFDMISGANHIARIGRSAVFDRIQALDLFFA